MTSYRIAAIAGDGIGPAIVACGKKVLEAAADAHGFSLTWTDYPFGADHYLKTGEILPEDSLKELEKRDAIYLGAIGDPRVAPGILEKGIILALRFHFDQYVNLRPIKLLAGVDCPLKDKGPQDIDFVVVRENTEDFYVGVGGRMTKGQKRALHDIKRHLYNVTFGLDVDFDGDEIAYQLGITTREGCQRLLTYAFDHAKKTGREKVTAVDKANVLSDMYGLWRDVVEDTSKNYPDIDHEFTYVDAITMHLVARPEAYDVVATPNMFGDIITDLGAMLQGGLGLAPGGNINPEGVSMFEPIHGSAPDIKDTNTANPLATVWAGALLLEELGEQQAASAIVAAIETLLSEKSEKKTLTPDLGGTATTSTVGDALAALVTAGG